MYLTINDPERAHYHQQSLTAGDFFCWLDRSLDVWPNSVQSPSRMLGSVNLQPIFESASVASGIKQKTLLKWNSCFSPSRFDSDDCLAAVFVLLVASKLAFTLDNSLKIIWQTGSQAGCVFQNHPMIQELNRLPVWLTVISSRLFWQGPQNCVSSCGTSQKKKKMWQVHIIHMWLLSDWHGRFLLPFPRLLSYVLCWKERWCRKLSGSFYKYLNPSNFQNLRHLMHEGKAWKM